MQDSEIDLRSILGLLRRQFRLIAVVFLAVVGIAATVAYTLTPIYSAATLIMVDPSNKNLLDPESQMTSASADNARIDGEVELARSDNVLLNVIQNENLIADPQFGVSVGTTARILAFFGVPVPVPATGADALDQSLGKLRNAVSVQRRGLTYLISIQLRSESPEQAAKLANAVANAYITDQLSSKVNATTSALSILQGRIEQARTAIATSEGSYDDFIANNIDKIGRSSGRADLQLMQSQIAALEAARDNASTLVTSVQTALVASDFETLVTSLQSDAVKQLDEQRQRLRRDLDQGITAPGQIDLQAELSRIEEQIKTTASSEISSLQATVQSNQTQEQTLRQSLRSAVIDSSLSPDVLAQIYEYQQGAELARSQYQMLLSRAQDLEAQADLQLADSRIVSPALTPQSATFPNKSLILALAGLAGLGIGVGLAFLYENFIGGFTSEEQVSAILGTTVAASTPREQSVSESDSLADLVVQKPLSIYAESVRRTRAAIDQSLRKRQGGPIIGGKVIMVTSTNPNEGKTTLALSLARAYALSGQSTLLVDCDLRKPSVHRHLGIDPQRGFVEILQSETDMLQLSDVLIKDRLSSATIVVGSRRSDLPTDQLLTNPAFERFLRAARHSFDQIVLDTPPVAPVVDALYIAEHVDVLIFASKWASTSQRDAKKCVDALNDAKSEGTQIISVLTQKEESKASYYKKYGSYYSYNT